MSMMIPVTFNIEILDKENFINTIAKEYEKEPNELYEDDILEFVQDNIRGAWSERNDLFLVEGIDTDGWFIRSVDTSGLI